MAVFSSCLSFSRTCFRSLFHAFQNLLIFCFWSSVSVGSFWFLDSSCAVSGVTVAWLLNLRTRA